MSTQYLLHYYVSAKFNPDNEYSVNKSVSSLSDKQVHLSTLKFVTFITLIDRATYRINSYNHHALVNLNIFVTITKNNSSKLNDQEMKMNKDNIAMRGICTLCPSCSLNTRAHYLHNKLIVSFCECRNLGGLYIGFSENPSWKLYTDMGKTEFLEFAQSAQAYVEVMRDLHLYSESA